MSGGTPARQQKCSRVRILCKVGHTARSPQENIGGSFVPPNSSKCLTSAGYGLPFRDANLRTISGVQERAAVNRRATGRRIHGRRTQIPGRARRASVTCRLQGRTASVHRTAYQPRSAAQRVSRPSSDWNAPIAAAPGQWAVLDSRRQVDETLSEALGLVAAHGTRWPYPEASRD